jgi:CheY-like chemotaxis protein/HPt (histidine-containing phosphotransfer) domain-containing protein
MDGDVMHRESFLRAVAIAAGRLHEEAEAQMPEKITAVVTPSREKALKEGRLILVAEDNEINQKVIRQQLSLLGYEADIATDGREALKRWESGNYALLLTDLHMPEIDGYQLTAAIRLAEQAKNERRSPIIAFTANALKGEAEHCRAVGMDDYLSKPVQLAHLNAILQKWLPPAATPAALPEAAPAPASPGTGLSAAGAESGHISTVIGKKPVDISVLEGLVGNEPEIVQEFLHDFRASSGRIAGELRSACEAGDPQAAGAAAHKLKSSARSVGALELGELSARMEQAGKAGDIEGLKVLLPQFDAELAAVDAYIRSHEE